MNERQLRGRTGALAPTDARRATTAAAIGHIVEYYDFAIYAILAPVIADVFFPSDDPATSLLATFSVFGVAYLARPLGGLVFGHFGDRIGRRRALSAVVLLMSAATGAVGLLPTHSQVGALAPALLVVCRALQGFSTGGEYSGSASFVAEHAPPNRRGFFTSWVVASTGIGLTIGALIGTFLTDVVADTTLLAWGWRIPFLLAIPLGVVGLYLRLRMEDGPEFKNAIKSTGTARMPVLEALASHPRAIATLAGLVLLLTVGMYVFFVYMTSYLHAFVGVPLSVILPASVIGYIAFFALSPAFGALSDRIGRNPILRTAAIAHVVVPLPAFQMLEHGTFASIGAAYLLLGATYAIYVGPFTATVTEQFTPRVRAASLGIGYNLPVCIFGGLSPVVLTFLIDRTGYTQMPAIYVMGAAVISGIVVLTLPTAASARASARTPAKELSPTGRHLGTGAAGIAEPRDS